MAKQRDGHWQQKWGASFNVKEGRKSKKKKTQLTLQITVVGHYTHGI